MKEEKEKENVSNYYFLNFKYTLYGDMKNVYVYVFCIDEVFLTECTLNTSDFSWKSLIFSVKKPRSQTHYSY
ncbi:unnamed protein product [Caenorhabditis angaria]|uniref:Uncharacterized protein n=1 Tax=Caenorhabditis angaria TaxID=860376 RepID=A0A9P1N851_9PELO|nr:unnamed protein product [Caenorhabditis angaria]